MLYIPHGSDNTNTIKVRGTSVQSFISHMVQIILSYAADRVHFVIALYIPHGSDNTVFRAFLRDMVCSLYIPHGSDNTGLYKTYPC